MFQRLNSILEKFFYIKRYFDNEKKWKLFNILGIKFKIRVRQSKDLRTFIANSRLEPLNYVDKTIREKVYISIVAIFKDETDIVDWINYHIKIGVERFYLYDNDSLDDYETILKDYIQSGVVVYRKICGNCMQKPVYRDAIFRFKNETEWMAIIDLDEYIVPVQEDNIKDFLRPYEKFSGVVVNGVMFDSNGIIKRPEGKSVIELFTRVPKDYQYYRNKTVKSIVKPGDVRYLNSVHVCIYKKGKYAVDENFNRYRTYVRTQTQYNSVSKIRINHYHCKSKEEYIEKINKGFADRITARKYQEDFLNFKEYVQDYVIWKYLDKN